MPNNAPLARRPANTRQNRRYRHRRIREIFAILSKHEVRKGIPPEKLRLVIEDLGPTFVKLGQILSMRRDILPKAYCEELEKLRADVRPLPYETIVAEIEQEYQKNPSEIFRHIDHKPLGSASIAQVHKAVLKDGTAVVLKVQRPGVYDTMAIDMSILNRAADLMDFFGVDTGMLDFRMILDEMWTTAQQEMDFRIEAQNAETFAQNNADLVYIDYPKIDHAYTTPKVLMMSYKPGIDINKTEELTAAGYDLTEISEKLAENYVKQIIDDAFFHADPHPGNLRIHDGKIVWIDMGMMGTLTARDCDLFRRAIFAVSQQNVQALKDIVLTIGEHHEKIDHPQLYADLSEFLQQFANVGMGDLNLADMLQEMLNITSRHKIAFPKGVTMLFRGVMTIEGVLMQLDPDLSLIQVMRTHATQYSVLDQIDLKRMTRHSIRSVYAAAKSGLSLPVQLSDVFDSFLKGHGKINIELTGSEKPIASVDRMVNRLVKAIVTAALLIGSSFIATTKMTPTIMGIPWLGFVGYFGAVVLGFNLLIGIHNSQHKKRKHRRRRP